MKLHHTTSIFDIPCSIFVILLLCVSVPLGEAHAAKIGFIHVEQIDGVWWFMDADGRQVRQPRREPLEPHLWLAPYNKEATLKRYGSDMVDAEGHFNTHGTAAKKWIDRQVEITRSLHFNTFGPHTHDSIEPLLYRDQVFYIARLDTAPLAVELYDHDTDPNETVNLAKSKPDAVKALAKQFRAQLKP